MTPAQPLTVSAPGRICLFGEHQDFLGLPVITAAINLRIRLRGFSTQEDKVRLDLPDLQEYTFFMLTHPLRYSTERDYFKSTLNVLWREGAQLKTGIEVTVRGAIPMNLGVSGSSALVVAWTAFLLKLMNDPRADDPLAVARLAHCAEVVEFKERGGLMNHFASAFGGLLFIESEEGKAPQRLPARLGMVVLGDSREPRDATAILSRVKEATLDGLKRLGKRIHDLNMDDLEGGKTLLTPEQFRVLHAQLVSRCLTRDAHAQLRNDSFDHQQFGHLLFKHYEQLRDGLRLSTPKIDRMIEAAMEAGALGAKTSGFGGMFAYAPEKFREVAEAIVREGGKAYIVRVADGIQFENNVRS
jgi:galactokinase